MFSDFNSDSEDESMLDQAKKKRKEHVNKFEVVHSSLDYRTIKVPLLVEYKNIDSYCEKKGENLLSGSGALFPSLGSISSPVVFRTPRPEAPLPRTPCHPYGFFSVEEISFVKVLTNWANVKVCVIGILDYTTSTKEWHVESKEEDESCKVLLDVSDFKAKLISQELQQVYGILSIHEGKPKIIVDFFRNLGSADLLLFVESYKLMQKYLPKSIKML